MLTFGDKETVHLMIPIGTTGLLEYREHECNCGHCYASGIVLAWCSKCKYYFLGNSWGECEEGVSSYEELIEMLTNEGKLITKEFGSACHNCGSIIVLNYQEIERAMIQKQSYFEKTSTPITLFQ